MLVPVNFINLYLKKKLKTDDIVAAFERTEVEVEEVVRSNSLDKHIVTAKVLKVWQHPNADRLKLAEISYNKAKARVVCGAPNLQEGMVVAYAKPGTVLPSGDRITMAVLRGEKSAGMLCSERELGRGDDHSGIAVLDPDLPLGISLCDIDNLGDIVNIKTPANRPDMLSILGLAREVCANSPNNSLVEPSRDVAKYENSEFAKIKEMGECKRFISAKLKINQNNKSPDWLVDNLKAAGMRPINPIVDITNFVMLETGQPSHAYDSAKLKGRLQVRFAKNGETLTTLDDAVRKLGSNDLVIADSSGVIGLAGVMGGKTTEVDENTKEIVLEVANFDGARIRRAATRHGIRTEASARFEKGLPLPLPVYAAERLLYLFKTICQAEVIDGLYDQLYAWPWIQHIGLRIRKAEAFLGFKLDEKQILNGLKQRGFSAEHFSITKEARKHLGKPYKWGANYKQDGTDAFDCSYLIDYIYSLIGVYIGHTALAQYNHGEAVEIGNLKPGDVVFYKGKIEHSVDDHYYIKDDSGNHVKQKLEQKKEVGHNGVYIGQGKVVMAAMYEYRNKKWVKRRKQGVIEVDLKEFTQNQGYLGARRYIDNFNHIIAVTAPWWRDDIRIEQDLYEEIAKIVGYENMPATLPQLPPTDTGEHMFVPNIMELKKVLVSRGLFEVMTYSFVNKNSLQTASAEVGANLKIVNPLSSEQEYLRSSLLMSHIQTVANNNSYWQGLYGFFEVSRSYVKSSTKKDGKHEQWKLAITVVGRDGIELLKNLLTILRTKYCWGMRITSNSNKNFVAGRSATIAVEKKEVGLFGQITPEILVGYKINNEVSFAEIDLSSDLLTNPTTKAKPTLPYQLVQRDITLEIASDIWWQDILDNLPVSNTLKRLEFVSEFANDKLSGKAKKRLSFRVWLDFGPNPQSKHINDGVNSIVSELKKHKNMKDIELC